MVHFFITARRHLLNIIPKLRKIKIHSAESSFNKKRFQREGLFITGFSMACLVLRVSASTFFALAEPGASGECSPVRSGRCAFWCGQHALGDVFCNYFFCACVRWEASAIERAKSGAGQGCQTRWRGSRPKAYKKDS